MDIVLKRPSVPNALKNIEARAGGKSVNPLDLRRMKIKVPTNVFLVFVTPLIAAEWLKVNTSNRKKKKLNLALVTEEMTKGDWVEGEDSVDFIGFNKLGKLINGQHTLNGIIASGKSLWLEVKLNMSQRSVEVMDTGFKRTAGDLLAMDSFPNPNEAATIAKFVMLFDEGRYSDAANSTVKSNSSSTTASNYRVKRFVKSVPDMNEIILDFKKFNKKTHRLLSTSHLCAFYILFRRKSTRDADDFFDKLITGTALSQTSPIYHLREKLLFDRTTKGRKMQLRHKVAYVVLAWNFYREEKRIKTLYFDPKEKFPKPI